MQWVTFERFSQSNSCKPTAASSVAS